jgi:hypothetical protein
MSGVIGNSDVERLTFLRVPYDTISALACADKATSTYLEDDGFWREKWALDFNGATSFKQLYLDAVKKIKIYKHPVDQFTHAAEHGWRGVARHILDTMLATADEYEKNNYLFGAVTAGWIDMAEELIDSGAAVNWDGDAAFFIAAENKDVNMARLLIKRGARPFDVWNTGQSREERYGKWLEEQGLYDLWQEVPVPVLGVVYIDH